MAATQHPSNMKTCITFDRNVIEGWLLCILGGSRVRSTYRCCSNLRKYKLTTFIKYKNNFDYKHLRQVTTLIGCFELHDEWHICTVFTTSHVYHHVDYRPWQNVLLFPTNSRHDKWETILRNLCCDLPPLHQARNKYRPPPSRDTALWQVCNNGKCVTMASV